MERESVEAAALQAALERARTEGDRLRTALATAESTIADLRRQAQATSRAKTDFMARMTHEIRTPLSAIIGLANLALSGQDCAAMPDYLVKIRVSAKTLLDVVDDITEFSRLEKGLADVVCLPFSPAELLDRLRARFADTARNKGLTLVTSLDPAIPTHLRGDQARLEQILGHLIGNAVKFTEHGRVLVQVRWLGCEGSLARLEFSVRDTGIGMAPETIPDMLESFTQADDSMSRPYGGTGLGLALVQRGLILLGANLRAESAPGQGSLFSFRVNFTPELPGTCPLPPDAPETAATPAPSDVPLAGAHILLVEDNAINQQVARETLLRCGATVDVAGHGGEAVDMVQARPYDVVLMDVQMPVMDGLAATRAIRELPGLAELPIVALTAHALAEDRDRCLAAGMNDYLTKPIEIDRLLATLGQWIVPAAARNTIQVATRPPLILPETSQTNALPAQGSAPPAGLDLATALVRLGGNDRLLRHVVAEFVREYGNCAEQLRQHLAGGNLDGARRLVHTVKGVAGNIAATALAASSRELEESLLAGAKPPEPALAAFQTALERTLADAARLEPSVDAPTHQSAGPSWRILLVDDARLNRAIFSQILKSAGHEVVAAINGKEACRLLFGEKRPERPFDCILMDIEMPEMDGLKAARLIRDLLGASVNPPCPPDIPIVALTFHDATAEAERCRRAGMDACLAKLFDREELLAGLGRILEGRLPGARERPAPPIPPATASALPALLGSLATHLREGSIRADEDLAALRELLANQPQPSELLDLAAAIERYDFHQAAACLDRLATVWGLSLQTDPPRAEATPPEP